MVCYSSDVGDDIYLLGLFRYLCFLIKIFFTVMICMLNKSCPDSADGLYSKKKIQMITIKVNFQ